MKKPALFSHPSPIVQFRVSEWIKWGRIRITYGYPVRKLPIKMRKSIAVPVPILYE